MVDGKPMGEALKPHPLLEQCQLVHGLCPDVLKVKRSEWRRPDHVFTYKNHMEKECIRQFGGPVGGSRGEWIRPFRLVQGQKPLVGEVDDDLVHETSYCEQERDAEAVKVTGIGSDMI